MTSGEIREKYLKFFESRGHAKIEPAPLVLESDPTTLFTSAGMQPLIPNLKGELHPKGKRLVDVQPSLRLQDIEEVGDNRHTTFFEMLGNWSLGDYFKAEQLPWVWEFFTKELGLPEEKLYISVFEGNGSVPKDEESYNIWKSLGVPDERIVFYGVKKNWWSRSGEPENMPAGEIGGPDSEVFFDFGTPHNPAYGEKCHPNCDCGRFLEIGNSVFIQYQKNAEGTLSELPQKNVDFGGGLERLTAAVNDEPDIFKTDVFYPVIKNLEEFTGQSYGGSENTDRSFRIITDHLRAALYIIAEGVLPGNKLQGYVVRRLIRRAVFRAFSVNKGFNSQNFGSLVRVMMDNDRYHFMRINYEEIESQISLEVRKFRYTIENGLKEAGKYEKLDANTAFYLYETYGFPVELTEEIAKEKGQKINKEEFEKEFRKHQEKSRTASAGMFKGGLADKGEDVTKLHTATHLLHAALRKILGEHVAQKGSNITAERLRFDFTNPEKLTENELQKVEDMVNEQVKKDLPVTCQEKPLDEAISEGALHFFAEKYGDVVKVYSIGDFSKEVCGGPHVAHTGELGRVKIIKQEKIGAGLVRIYAKLE